MHTEHEIGAGDVITVKHKKDAYPTHATVCIDGNRLVVTRQDTGDVLVITPDDGVQTSKLVSRVNEQP